MNTSLQHANENTTTSAPNGEGFAKPPDPATAKAARWLALGAVVGPVLFTLAWFVILGLLVFRGPSGKQSESLTARKVAL